MTCPDVDPREYCKIKYSAPPGACKCGNCQLVPPERLIEWSDALEAASEIIARSSELIRDGWQSFSTAPKDGTPILCFHPDDAFKPITGIDLIWWEPSPGIWTMDGDNPVPFVATPTHWRPLPAPPEESSNG